VMRAVPISLAGLALADRARLAGSPTRPIH
jgi:hypothetical protein